MIGKRVSWIVYGQRYFGVVQRLVHFGPWPPVLLVRSDDGQGCLVNPDTVFVEA